MIGCDIPVLTMSFAYITDADCSLYDSHCAVAEVLAERADFVKERGMEALGPLMGVVMGKLGGAADGKAVSAALKEQIQRLL